MSDKKYFLEMTAEHAEILVRALDCYSRIGIGQFENVLEVYSRGIKTALDPDAFESAREGLNEAKAAAGHPASGSHGIHNPEVSDEFRAAFDMQKVIRARLAYDKRPEGNPASPHFDTTYAISKYPLPIIKSV